MKSTPFVRQYGMLNNKWGAFALQKGKKSDIMEGK